MQNRANGIRFYTHKIWRMESDEWNSRLHRRNPPTRVEEANGIGRMEFASTQALTRIAKD